MNAGTIIAFRATGKRRNPTKDEVVRYSDGDIYSGPSTLFGDILIPLTPAEIAAAQRTLAAVEKWRHLLTAISAGNQANDVYLAQMAKEIIGS